MPPVVSARKASRRAISVMQNTELGSPSCEVASAYVKKRWRLHTAMLHTQPVGHREHMQLWSHARTYADAKL